jgi:hypothetical protein
MSNTQEQRPDRQAQPDPKSNPPGKTYDPNKPRPTTPGSDKGQGQGSGGAGGQPTRRPGQETGHENE